MASAGGLAGAESGGGCLMLPGPGSPLAGIEKYLAHGERVIFVLRRHAVVLKYAIGIWLLAVAAGVGAGVLSGRWPHAGLGAVGGWIVLAGAGGLGGKTWARGGGRYLVTAERALPTEGGPARGGGGGP